MLKGNFKILKWNTKFLKCRILRGKFTKKVNEKTWNYFLENLEIGKKINSATSILGTNGNSGYL